MGIMTPDGDFFDLDDFIKQSNHIEGVQKYATTAHASAHRMLFAAETITARHMTSFVRIITDGQAALRNHPRLNVTVGAHIAPLGGQHIESVLDGLLEDKALTPKELHDRFLTLHPFTDGNGRAARALWLMSVMDNHDQEPKTMGILHRHGILQTFYYLNLSQSDDVILDELVSDYGLPLSAIVDQSPHGLAKE